MFLCTGALGVALSAASEVKPFLPFKVAKTHIQSHIEENTQELTSSWLESPHQVDRLYQKFNHRTIWFDHYEMTDAGKALVQAIKENAVDQPENYPYHADEILYRLQIMQTLPLEVTELDVLLTDAFLSYAKDAMNGRLIPNRNEPDHPAILKTSSVMQTPSHMDVGYEANIVDMLGPKLERHKLKALIDQDLTPANEGYRRLRKALDHYLDLIQSGLWFPLNESVELKMGDTSEQVEKLRQQLSLLGDFYHHEFNKVPTRDFLNPQHRDFNTPLAHLANRAPLEGQDYFDQPLADALKHFQSRHGLVSNGILDTKTIQYLNIPPEQRVKQIVINMKRWRYLPEDLGQRHIMVNMANYSLDLVENNKTVLDMDVIVGKASRRTPILVQKMKTLVLNPTWAIPPRIAQASILPKAKKDPGYLNKRNIELVRHVKGERKVIDPYKVNWKKVNLKKFPYRLEQTAGEHNALGSVKFPLNNDFAIYLHDTSQPELFDEEMRALSSGCVRVSEPRKLTEELLKYNPGWDSSRIQKIHDRKRTIYVAMKKEVPTYLMYWTAWVDDHGTLQFRDDIYQRDHLNADAMTLSMN